MKSLFVAVGLIFASFLAIAQTMTAGSVVSGSRTTVATAQPTGANSGDVFINTSTGNVYQYDGSSWGTSLMNVLGATGAIGATGGVGPTGPQGVPGVTANAQLTTNAAGVAVWTYPAACNTASKFWAQPIAASGSTLVNVQNTGVPTGTTQTFQVNLTNFSTVALIGLTILSVPASPGVTTINVFCV